MLATVFYYFLWYAHIITYAFLPHIHILLPFFDLHTVFISQYFCYFTNKYVNNITFRQNAFNSILGIYLKLLTLYFIYIFASIGDAHFIIYIRCCLDIILLLLWRLFKVKIRIITFSRACRRQKVLMYDDSQCLICLLALAILIRYAAFSSLATYAQF